MHAYSFHERSLGGGREVRVRRDDDDATVGRVVRGEIDGCEKRGTFRFEPDTGAPTSVGIHRATSAVTVLRRLLRPRYLLVHDGASARFTDRLGENVLYFAVTGKLDGRRVDARQDWDDSVQVTVDAEEVGRFRPQEDLGRTHVRVRPDGPAAAVGSALFGLMVLLPFLHRVYTDETDVVEALLG